MRHTALVAAGVVVMLTGCAQTDAQAPASVPASDPLASARSAAGAPASQPVERPLESSTREITLPAGTVLPASLSSTVGSDTSQVEDEVRATLRRAVTSNDVEVLPAGTTLVGHVTRAERSGRVKGRASVAFRFTRVDLPGPGGAPISASPISRVAPATKKQDAMKIGGGAAGGAIIGGILGGGSGAAKGAAIGGAGGTGVVLATKGPEVHFAAGAALSVRLTSPLTVQVPR